MRGRARRIHPQIAIAAASGLSLLRRLPNGEIRVLHYRTSIECYSTTVRGCGSRSLWVGGFMRILLMGLAGAMLFFCAAANEAQSAEAEATCLRDCRQPTQAAENACFQQYGGENCKGIGDKSQIMQCLEDSYIKKTSCNIDAKSAESDCSYKCMAMDPNSVYSRIRASQGGFSDDELRVIEEKKKKYNVK